EVYRCGDVACISCGDRIDARLCGPRIEPSKRLRQAWLIAEVIGISQIVRELLSGKRGRHPKQISSDRTVELLPGRWRRPCSVRRAHTMDACRRPGASRQKGQRGGRADSLQE